MPDKIEVIESDEVKVGLTVMLSQKVFKKLMLLSHPETPEGWSAVITRLIEKAPR